MFWARARRTYAGVSAEDSDIKRYAELAARIQSDGYEGLTGFVQDLGHKWVAAHARGTRVLEIGTGTGRHTRFFRGRPESLFASEYEPVHLTSEAWLGPLKGRGVRCDARRLPFASASFDSVVSIYNLEHIAELQPVFSEVRRVLVDDGLFLVALPCEGGLAWNLGRELTTRRIYRKKYAINYDKVIAYEHVWDSRGVLRELRASGCFHIERQQFLPFGLPTPHMNLIVCLQCRRLGAEGARVP